ncbi:host-nuclease inhibitor protein Gam [Desulfonema ishimotonii]|uniref:Host-nuclease inhibitor protein Gam n=1 Tax=Desulfonema ishimotonii TaxID=45657 RepID=A0A401FZY0_9BACT|nr:host-nuclease inhibitor Gam family protein [Desulfonema ishimotonii]GBC62510.1 host-nuclease inhibitor protein Gam [Desulfonema ishimotonii]
MARVKPEKREVIKNLKDADSAMAEIGHLAREIGGIKMNAASEIDRIKADADAKITPLAKRIKEIEAGLSFYAEYNKDDLFQTARSRDLVFGVFGFRRSTKLKPLAKWTWKKVLGALKDGGFKEAIALKERENREVLSQWPDDRLASVGVARDARDSFWYEVKEEALEADK